MELRLQACDTVFFLDYPVEVCLDGVMARKGKSRPDMPWTESPEGPDEEFLTYIRQFGERQRPFVLELLARYPQKEIIVFRSRDEAQTYWNDRRNGGVAL